VLQVFGSGRTEVIEQGKGIRLKSISLKRSRRGWEERFGGRRMKGEGFWSSIPSDGNPGGKYRIKTDLNV